MADEASTRRYMSPDLQLAQLLSLSNGTQLFHGLVPAVNVQPVGAAIGAANEMSDTPRETEWVLRTGVDEQHANSVADLRHLSESEQSRTFDGRKWPAVKTQRGSRGCLARLCCGW